MKYVSMISFGITKGLVCKLSYQTTDDVLYIDTRELFITQNNLGPPTAISNDKPNTNKRQWFIEPYTKDMKITCVVCWFKIDTTPKIHISKSIATLTIKNFEHTEAQLNYIELKTLFRAVIDNVKVLVLTTITIVTKRCVGFYVFIEKNDVTMYCLIFTLSYIFLLPISLNLHWTVLSIINELLFSLSPTKLFHIIYWDEIDGVLNKNLSCILVSLRDTAKSCHSSDVPIADNILKI